MIPLVVRSHYSLMRGTAPVDELVRHAAKLGYRTLALTDMDNLYGLWSFLKSCKIHGVRPVVGAQITDPSSDMLVACLVKSQTGYENLCQIITARKIKKGFDVGNELENLGEGLCILTNDGGLLGRLREAGLDAYAAIPRKPAADSADLRKTAVKIGAPVVAAPDNFFLNPGGLKLHLLLRAIALNSSLSRLESGDAASADAWLSSPKEYEKRFSILPEALEETHGIAERCEFTGPDTTTVFPPWDGGGRTAGDVLRETAYAGAEKRYGAPPGAEVKKRLEYELGIISQKGFSEYFLVVRDIVLRSPRICGRGSGAASLVAYCLEITNVCPMKNNLYFERFLNPGRKDPPDIDVDFAWDERADVIASVLRQYEGRSAMVCNHVFFQPRMAIRETAKVFGLGAGEIAEVADKVPWFRRQGDEGLLEGLRRLPNTRGLGFGEPWPEILRLAGRLVGTPRNISVHPGGVVITPGPISQRAPLELKLDGVPVIQWEKDGAEEAGLVKIDLLGNRSLGVIRDAIDNIRADDRAFDEGRWEPEEDEATRSTVAKGLTMGCFYIESPAMRLLQEKSGKGDFNHLVIHSSIIRPAANEFIREYLLRLRGAGWKPIHPLLDGVLDETFGIMVYQEDVSRVAVALAGFSHSDADRLRKIMSKKEKELELNDFRQKFERGAMLNGATKEQVEEIWRMILSFDGYSFCKPHSASYARVSFQAAYLKTHFPAEFMAAVISNQGGFYSAFAYVSEAKRLGCKILPPDVNKSGVKWHGHDRCLRVGLLSVKNLGGETAGRMAAEREHGLYKDFDDFMARVRPAEDEARALIFCGAFDEVEPLKSRADLLWLLASRRKSDGDGLDTGVGGASGAPPKLPPDDETGLLRRQYSTLGFLCDHHPIIFYDSARVDARSVKAADVRRMVGKTASFAGWLITGKVVTTKHGEPMEFLTFEDETGVLETVFFPKTYRKFCSILDSHRPYLLRGKVEEDFGAVTMSVNDVRAL
ncbi:MAG: DNA polymerase III subunit alpha [Nitrospinae bacterium]|nr:DNA polymerase III subunit alpha [Nitrospinota bacterium]